MKLNSDLNKKLLLILSKLINELEGKCFLAVFGGLAIDAYYGKLTREHEDIDIICWRKDIKIVREALRTIGFNSEVITHHKEKDLAYIIKTTDENKIISFQIADSVDNQNFEISFWPYAHFKFSNKYLKVKWKKLEDVKFPVVARRMLIELKEAQIDLYKNTKKENEEKYLLKQKQKHLKALHDLEQLK